LREGQSPIESRECLPPERAARERLVFGLRRLAGVELDEFQSTTGFAVEQIMGAHLSGWRSAGLIVVDDRSIRLTHRGLMVSDSLWPEIL
jgi:oxygen-independent coproporphyrinogen-3 oxidase